MTVVMTGFVGQERKLLSVEVRELQSAGHCSDAAAAIVER